MIDFSGYNWFDSNGDGALDLGTLDTNGDGYFETTASDVNADLVVDVVGQDSNGDGVIDTVWTDPSGDGSFTTVSYDTNGDGVVDTTYNPDGTVTAVEPVTPVQDPGDSVMDGTYVGGGDPGWTYEGGDVVADNTYVGGGNYTDPLLGLPDSAYTDPVTGPMIANIFETERRMTEIWALPDNVEVRYERY